MREGDVEGLRWRKLVLGTIERLDAVERLLLKPEASALGALVENLELSWRDLCVVEVMVRGGSRAPAWQAELEQVRARVSRLGLLLEHARGMVDGCYMACAGGYGIDGGLKVQGLAARGRVDEKG